MRRFDHCFIGLIRSTPDPAIPSAEQRSARWGVSADPTLAWDSLAATTHLTLKVSTHTLNFQSAFRRSYGRLNISIAVKVFVACPGQRLVGGGRNNALNTAAFRLGQLAARGGLDEAAVWTQLTDAALTAGLRLHEARRTIASGWQAGLRRPRR